MARSNLDLEYMQLSLLSGWRCDVDSLTDMKVFKVLSFESFLHKNYLVVKKILSLPQNMVLS